MEDVPVLRTSVFGEVSEIAVDKPCVLGGQTTAGYDSLNLLVETVVLKILLNRSTPIVMEIRMMTRRFFMQLPHLQSLAYGDQPARQALER